MRVKLRAAEWAHWKTAWASSAGAEPADRPHGRRSADDGGSVEPL